MENKFDWSRFKKVQENLPNVPKGGKGNFRSYMKLEDLNPALLKILNANDFVWVTMPTAIDGQPGLAYKVVDTLSGESIDGQMLLAMDKNTPQGQGSGITYARRYALCAVTGIVADMDDDGHTASVVTDTPKTAQAVSSKLATPKQKKLIADKLAEMNIKEKEDIQYYLADEFGISDTDKMTIDDASSVIESLIG